MRVSLGVLMAMTAVFSFTAMAIPDEQPTGGLSIPVSNQILGGKVALPDGEVINFRVFDGALLKVRDVKNGVHWGISVLLQRNEMVRLVVFDISQPAAGLEAMNQVAVLRSGLGEVVRFGKDEPFEIVVDQVIPSKMSNEEFLKMQRQTLLGGGRSQG